MIATSGVGNLQLLLDAKARVAWDGCSSLGSIVCHIAEHRNVYRDAAIKMAKDFSAERYGRRLLGAYESVLEQAGRRGSPRNGDGIPLMNTDSAEEEK